ncbi:sugar phosphate isomerase/epimerase [Acidisoma cellulosilytica]|uniref:Sugar phosphate isomerase/epimerase n=1 Tax=Acidisoma cellulosilyticum TaxID=2802395 RepID=A0A963Z714_9PROT|nr:sugar phosphate isomerase/epimerase [Acidisoma cellulosilyticum]MCB8883768.1 sugar phosphate isomerase/epimerase [Acidisoma cellulosilyticum]
MKIGFYTSTFGDQPIEAVLDFAVEAGFDAIEIDIGRHVGKPERVRDVAELARARGLSISSFVLFGGQLRSDTAEQTAFRNLTRDFATALGEARVPVFVLFGGVDASRSDDANYESLAEQGARLLAATKDSSLQFAIENWPGPENRFVAVTPDGWHKLFDLLQDERFGLEFDPSHLVRLGIDPLRALDAVHHRVKILHAKDAAIDAELLQAVGYAGEGWWRYTLPGRGLVDWAGFLRKAQGYGFDGTLSIEHEDEIFGWPAGDLGKRKDGERESLRYLREVLQDL